MWPISAYTSQALRGSHQVAIRATAYTAQLGVLTNLPLAQTGYVTVDTTSQVRRTATVTVADPTLWPANPFDVLSPLGSELQIDYGVSIVGGTVEWIPLMRGVIAEADRYRPSSSGSGAVPLSLSDRSLRISEDRLAAPMQVGGGSTTVVAAITNLITRTLPSATIIDQTGDTTVAPTLDVQQDCWADGVEKLAAAIGAECFADPVGNFVIRYQPVITASPAWIANTGPNGIIVRTQDKLARDQVYNAVVASGQRSDSVAPATATVTDNDPTSPTYYGGPFGRKPRFYVSPLLTTTAQCTSAASAILARAKGMQDAVTLFTVTNPALDGGDVISFHDTPHVAAHIIDSVNIPLTIGDPQQIVGRAMALPDEQASTSAGG